MVLIYLDFLKTSYASNYFWDSEYFWDIFIRYFLNFFYGPPLLVDPRRGCARGDGFFFINQGASKVVIDFCFVLLKSGTRGGDCICAHVLLLRWS